MFPARLKIILPLILCALLLVAYFFRHSNAPSPEAEEKSSTQQEARSSPKKLAEPSQTARAPSAIPKGSMEDFEGESSGRWTFQKSSDGFITRMSGGSFRLPGEHPAAELDAFLERFGAALYGIDSGQYAAPTTIHESEATQVVYEQKLHGLAVENSRASFFLDANGSVVYAVVDLYTGKNPPSPNPSVSAASASSIARTSLLRFLDDKSVSYGPGDYPQEFFLQHGELAYRLTSPNSISLVYKYEFQLSGTHDNDMKMMIDASNGAVVLLKTLSSH